MLFVALVICYLVLMLLLGLMFYMTVCVRWTCVAVFCDSGFVLGGAGVACDLMLGLLRGFLYL